VNRTTIAISCVVIAAVWISAQASAANEDTAARVSRWAYLLRPAPARTAPTLRASVVTLVRTATPEGESNLVRILDERRDEASRDWVKIDLTIRPNGSTGWIPRDALGETHLVRTRLIIDRQSLTATLWERKRVLFQAKIGVGTTRNPTPPGTFTIRERLAGFADPFYGPIAFGTTARSPVLSDWPGGGFIGIHGTNQPNLIPGHISHGCVRLRNTDIRRLAQLMPLGTPVEIH
jgi:lipoprotein-anchoring transpeptidase ErfK/SrfK